MVQSLEELITKFHKLSTQFEGFQEMMQESLDMWSGMEAWRLTAGESFGVLLEKTTSVTERIDSAMTRITRLEQHLSPLCYRYRTRTRLLCLIRRGST